jgi:hypothetical protein
VPYELCTHGSDQTTKKELFIETLLPLVLLENESIAQQRDRMLGLFERLEHSNPLSAGEQLWRRPSRTSTGYRVIPSWTQPRGESLADASISGPRTSLWPRPPQSRVGEGRTLHG